MAGLAESEARILQQSRLLREEIDSKRKDQQHQDGGGIDRKGKRDIGSGKSK